MTAGSLLIVGTGIKLVAEAGVAVEERIRAAEKVFFVAGDPAKATWLTQLNPQAVSLHSLYQPGKPRIQTYQEMVARILEPVRQGYRVCAVFYGHPGVFVWPSHEAIRQARAEGYTAEMLPGVSAEDCLFADLEMDPLATGCQRFEATNFLLYNRPFDPTAVLVLWQIGVIGEAAFPPERADSRGLSILTERLLDHYPPDHEVIIYEAAQYAVLKPRIERRPLRDLPQAAVSPISTLCVPPLPLPRLDPQMQALLFPKRPG